MHRLHRPQKFSFPEIIFKFDIKQDDANEKPGSVTARNQSCVLSHPSDGTQSAPHFLHYRPGIRIAETLRRRFQFLDEGEQRFKASLGDRMVIVAPSIPADFPL